MTSPARQVVVECPRCNFPFEATHRASVNLSLGETWTEQDLRDLNRATCPDCGHRFKIGEALIISWEDR